MALNMSMNMSMNMSRLLRTPAGGLCTSSSACPPARPFTGFGFLGAPKAPKAPAQPASDELVASFSARPVKPLTLHDLVRHGRPPLKEHELLESAKFSAAILPTRLAHRIQALRGLPFIVVTNRNISQILKNYERSFESLLPFADGKISTEHDEQKFTDVLTGFVNAHSHSIPQLAQGFLESRKYISPLAVSSFIDEHLRARIGARLIAEQHIKLHNATHQGAGDSTYIGVIDTALRPTTIIQNCEAFVSDVCEFRYGVRPSVVINGEPETTIAHIPAHLEYILTELLKNAFRATIERGNEREPVEITIAPFSPDDDKPESKSEDKSDPTQPLETASPGVTIRIRDQGGGIDASHLPRIWEYAFTTFDEDQAASASGSGVDGLDILSSSGNNASSIAGLGYGLPLSRAYAEYFGGGISVQSLDGWGTDVYLRLRGLGRVEPEQAEGKPAPISRGGKTSDGKGTADGNTLPVERTAPNSLAGLDQPLP